MRDRWWLRLSPEDVDARNESFMDSQAWMAANGMTNGMSSALLVPALCLPALHDAAAPAPASQQDSRVLLPASGDDCDVSMDLTAEIAGIIDVLEEEARPRPQAWRLEQTNEERAEQHFGSQLVEYERNMAERARRLERTVRRSRVRSRLWRRTMPSRLPGGTLPSNSAIGPCASRCARNSTATVHTLQRDFFREQFNDGARRVEQYAHRAKRLIAS